MAVLPDLTGGSEDLSVRIPSSFQATVGKRHCAALPLISVLKEGFAAGYLSVGEQGWKGLLGFDVPCGCW